LTFYGATLGREEIRKATLNPKLDLDPGRGVITIVLPDRTILTGIPRNEDNFSLQIQTPDGSFHLLIKRKFSRSPIKALVACRPTTGLRLPSPNLTAL